MKLTTADIERELKEHKEHLEAFDWYRSLPGDEKKTVAEIVMEADIDSEEFNTGFEQGYIRGMESLLALSKENII